MTAYIVGGAHRCVCINCECILYRPQQLVEKNLYIIIYTCRWVIIIEMVMDS